MSAVRDSVRNRWQWCRDGMWRREENRHATEFVAESVTFHAPGLEDAGGEIETVEENVLSSFTERWDLGEEFGGTASSEKTVVDSNKRSTSNTFVRAVVEETLEEVSTLGGHTIGVPRWLQCVEKLSRSLPMGSVTRASVDMEIDTRPTSTPISVTVSDVDGALVTIHGLRATDTLAMLRCRLANEMAAQPVLLELSLGNRKFSACAYSKKITELGISDGTQILVFRKHVAEIGGHLYTLTERLVDLDGDIRKAVRAEFGANGSVADFSQLADLALDVCREDFDAFLEALGPFVNARIGFRNYAWRQKMYLQKGTHAKYQGIHGQVSLRPGAFHPMRVLVHLGCTHIG